MSAPSSDSAGIRQAIRALRADGWELRHVYDGGENVPVKNETEAVASVLSVDDAYLFVRRADEKGWVRFVMGNDPEEVICDYTVNLTCLDTLTESWY